MPVEGPRKTKQYHPTKRRVVVATADVQFQQVQIVDKDGQIRNLIVWRCGPDQFYGETLADLSDPARIRVLPTWVREQLEVLPAASQFDFRGKPKSGEAATAVPEAEIAIKTLAKHVVADADDDLPDFKSA